MSKDKTAKSIQYHEANSSVDYQVKSNKPMPKPKPQNSYWQQIIIVLLLITIFASITIIIVQSSRVSSLESQNSSLLATVEALQTQNTTLQNELDRVQKLISPTPTPKP